MATNTARPIVSLAAPSAPANSSDTLERVPAFLCQVVESDQGVGCNPEVGLY